MSILDAFRTAAAAPATTIAPASAAGNPLVPNGATVVPVAGGPAAIPGAPAVADTEKSPLANFEKLWETPVVDPNKPAPQSVVPSFNIDPAALATAVKGMNFASAVTPELAKKAMEGDHAAFAEAINSASQAAFSQAMQGTSKIVERAVTQTVERMKSTMLPEMMNKHTIANHLSNENPILDNPAVAPIADMLREQIIAKNPNASAADVNAQARQYLAGFAKMISDAKIGAAAPTEAGPTKVVNKVGGAADDWTDFFSAK